MPPRLWGGKTGEDTWQDTIKDRWAPAGPNKWIHLYSPPRDVKETVFLLTGGTGESRILSVIKNVLDILKGKAISTSEKETDHLEADGQISLIFHFGLWEYIQPSEKSKENPELFMLTGRDHARVVWINSS